MMDFKSKFQNKTINELKTFISKHDCWPRTYDIRRLNKFMALNFLKDHKLCEQVGTCLVGLYKPSRYGVTIKSSVTRETNFKKSGDFGPDYLNSTFYNSNFLSKDVEIPMADDISEISIHENIKETQNATDLDKKSLQINLFIYLIILIQKMT